MTQATPIDQDAAASPLATILDVYEREHATTAKVLRAYPPEQSELRPHERSNTARQLAWTFVLEERMLLLAVRDGKVLGGDYPTMPDTWSEVLDMFDAQRDEVVRALREADADAARRTVQFYTAPKQLGEYALPAFCWFMIYDQIHHRGQLSVYLRMAGGKVPSIYGPSADEPWT